MHEIGPLLSRALTAFGRFVNFSLAAPGYWGAPTSSIDWCEQNYRHSFYVAEMFNTVSSLAMVLAGALGMYLHRRLALRFLLAFASVLVVGLGSIAFHATLRFEHQVLDEVPMLYAVILMVYILVESQPKRRFGIWFPAALVAHALLVTVLATFTRGDLQFYLFHISFGSLELFSLYSVYRLSRRSSSKVARRLFRVGISMYLLAIALWFVDLRFCPWVSVTLPAYGIPNPELHAVWHILVSGGFYVLLLLIVHDRLMITAQEPELCYFCKFVPYVRPVSTPASNLAPSTVEQSAPQLSV